MYIPTNQDFATEVKFDRLRQLWRVTLVASVIVGWALLNVSMLQHADVARMVIPLVIFVLAAAVTRAMLSRGAYLTAARVYVMLALIALGVTLAVGSAGVVTVIPFAFPILIFVVGLLLQPSATVIAAVIGSAFIYFVMPLNPQAPGALPVLQAAAIILTLVSAFVAALVAGDLYQIAEWALENYQRERRVAGELFESREALEQSLARSTALGERLQETNDELDHARAAAEEAKHFRGQFLANMSHELRTPLNAIIGFSETMLRFPAMYEGVRLPNAYEADLQQIYTSGRQLLTLINDILDLAKVDAGKLEMRMERVYLQPLLTNVVSTASGLVGNKPVRLETEIPEYLPDVWADEARVRQVLLNLYSNAAKFTEHGIIRLTAREYNDGVLISLTDTGIGISEGNREVIFEEFKQAETGARDPRAGAGLGLAISRQLMTLMGGRIWVDSEVGKGSTFHFTLQPYQDSVELIEPAMVEANQ
jgi:signal transduction histidine kinase